MLPDERQVLARICREVAGRLNAWTTLEVDSGIDDVVRSLVAQGLLERYASGLRITDAALEVLWSEAQPPEPPIEELRQREREEEGRRAKVRQGAPTDLLAQIVSIEGTYEQ